MTLSPIAGNTAHEDPAIAPLTPELCAKYEGNTAHEDPAIARLTPELCAKYEGNTAHEDPAIVIISCRVSGSPRRSFSLIASHVSTGI